jgi:hypothetical protein
MGYRLEWRLVGRANTQLDNGQIGGEFAERRSALEALKDLLLTFPLWGRVEAGGFWWARRSPEADLELQFTLCEVRPPADDRMPVPWTRVGRRQGTSVPA